MSANKFLSTSAQDVSNGTLSLFGVKIGAKDLLDPIIETVKINSSGCLYPAKINSGDLVGVIANPMTENLDVNGFQVQDVNLLEITNATNNITLNYSGSVNTSIDLQTVKEIEDVTQNFNTSTTVDQTDIDGDLTVETDIQFGGALIGNLTINDIDFATTQTDDLKVDVQNTVTTEATIQNTVDTIVTDIAFTTTQTDDLNVNVQNTVTTEATIQNVVDTILTDVNFTTTQTQDLEVAVQNTVTTEATIQNIVDMVITDVNFTTAQTEDLEVAVQNTVTTESTIQNVVDTIITDINFTTTQTDNVNVNVPNLEFVEDDLIDASSKGIVMMGTYESKTSDKAIRLKLNVDDDLITNFTNTSLDDIQNPLYNWLNIDSDYWSPMTSKYFNFQGDAITDAAGVLSVDTLSTDYQITRTARKYKFVPNSRTEIILTSNLSYLTTGTDSADYNLIGIWSDDITSTFDLPQNAVWIKGSRGNVDPNDWGVELILDGSTSATYPGLIAAKPQTDRYNQWKFIIGMFAIPIIKVYEYNGSSGNWDFLVQISFPQTDTFSENEFYIGNVSSSSSPVVSRSKLYSYSVKQEIQSVVYNTPRIYQSYFMTSNITLMQDANFYGIIALRLKPTNTTQSQVHLHSVDLLGITSGNEWLIQVYKNPTMFQAFVWVDNGRIQRSIQSNTNYITTGLPSFSKFYSNNEGGNSETVIKIPEESMTLYDTDDIIVFGVQSIGKAASFRGGLNYYY